MARSSTSCTRTDPRRGGCAGDRHQRQPPAAPVRDHHRRLRPSQHLLRAPRLCDQAAGGHPAGRQLVRVHRLGRRGRRLDRSDRSGARPTRASASRSRRTTWRARPRRRIALPGAQNAFRRMHLNEWTEQAERWIDLAGLGRLQRCSRPGALARADLLRRPRPLDHHRRHGSRLGVPARAGRWPLACAVALLRARGELQEARRARPRAL